MSRIFAVALATALVIPAVLQAQDAKALLGDWEMINQTPRGTVTSVLSFTMEGERLVGSVTTAQMGTAPLTNVVYKDGTVSFDVEREFNGRVVTTNYKATIKEHVMTGTVKTPRGEREFTAKHKM